MPQHDTVNTLQRLMLDGGQKAFDLVPKLLSRVIEEKQWAHHQDKNGVPFASFEAFVSHPYWHGLESSIDDLRAYCRRHDDVRRLIEAAVDPLDTRVDAGAKGGRGNKASDNVTSFRGNSATYTLKRLKRDRPDLLERVTAGELSANAAAREAGWRKVPSALDRLRKDWAKATPKERRTFLGEVR
jgi:hypothetical protein